MRVGLIDVDGGKTFPNIALMKISAWHKAQGDNVQWYDPFDEWFDVVYMAKVFSFTPDYDQVIRATEVHRGGTGYCFTYENGKEVFHPELDKPLSADIDKMFSDYSLYPHLTKDTAFGFLTRGCPRGCDFCIVGKKEGKCSVKVADLKDFWNGQKNIVLCDPNILACKDWKELLQSLIDSKAWVDFNQGLDIRLMTEEKARMLSKIKIRELHFAWDKYPDKDMIIPKFKLFAKCNPQMMKGHRMVVYTLVNFDTTLEQDLERIYTLRELGYWAYVMVYDKEHCDPVYRRLQRWVNMRSTFAKVKRFEDYMKKEKEILPSLFN